MRKKLWKQTGVWALTLSMAMQGMAPGAVALAEDDIAVLKEASENAVKKSSDVRPDKGEETGENSSGNETSKEDDAGNKEDKPEKEDSETDGSESEEGSEEETGDEESGEEGSEETGDEESGEEGSEETGDEESGEEGSEETGDEESGEEGSEETGDEESGEEGSEETGDEESGEDGTEEGAGNEESGEDGTEETGDEESGEEGTEEGAGNEEPGEDGTEEGAGNEESGEDGTEEGAGNEESGEDGTEETGTEEDAEIDEGTEEVAEDEEETLEEEETEENVWLLESTDKVEYLDIADEAEAGYSTWQQDKDFEYGSLRLKMPGGDVRTFEKGLMANAPAWGVYNVEDYRGKYFYAWAGVHIDAAGNDGGTCKFKVFFKKAPDENGKEAEWEEKPAQETGVLTAESEAVRFFIEIPEDAYEMKIEMDDTDDGDEYDHAVWAKASIVDDESVLKTIEELSVEAPGYLDVEEQGELKIRGRLFSEEEIVFGENITVECESGDEDILQVEEKDGKWFVTGTGDGIGTITVTATNTETGETTEASADVIVGEAAAMTAVSPNEENRISFYLMPGKGNLVYRIFNGREETENEIASGQTTGLVTNLGDFTEGLELVGEPEWETVEDSYDLIGAKKSHVDAVGTEMTMTFKKANPEEGQEDVRFTVIARAYDDGVAFRYQISSDEKKELIISRENTAVELPDGAKSWAMDFINHNEAIEKEHTNSTLNGAYCMPLLFESEGTYGLISEAALTQEYAGAALYGDGTGRLEIRFSEGDRIPTDEVVTSTSVLEPWAEEGEEHPWVSPWRFVVIGDLSDINGNTMAETLSPDAVIDTDWIEPGACAWTWLNGEGTSSGETYKEYVDLAAEMGWEYILLDEGWQPKATGEAKEKGYVYYGYYDWFDELMEYAREKGVGVFVWANNADLNTEEKQEVIDEWAEKGVKGIKPDFFNSHSQEQMEIYMQLMKKTSENHMILNIHGAPKTTGERRTYPHLLTREGIHGAEQIIFKPSEVTAKHNCTLPFVRNAVGPADYTPMLSLAVHDSPYGGGSTYSYKGHFTAGQMAAMPVVIETGINCMADRADIYRNSPVYPLYKDMPAAWENSQVLEGEVGSYVTIERETEDGTYYVASICDEARTAEVDLDFLPEGEDFYAYIAEDGDGPDVLTVRSEEVTSEDVLTLPLQETGGALVVIQSEPMSEVQEVTLSEHELEITVGETASLTASVSPEDAEIKSVIWESSDERVARVENGTIIPVEPGIVTITARSGAGSDECRVMVYPREYEKTEQWTVENENPANWALEDENTLTIQTQTGGLYLNGNNAYNEFLMNADKDFDISVRLTFDPVEDYQSAGLLVMAGQSYAGVWRRYHSGLAAEGKNNVLNFLSYDTAASSGKYKEEFTMADNNPENPVWFRLKKEGETITAYMKGDTGNWWKMGEYTNTGLEQNDSIRVGVYAANDSGKTSIPATFENFSYQPAGAEEPSAVAFGKKAPVEVMGIELLEEGKTEYEEGEEFDPSGYTFTVYYTDRTEEVISGSDCVVTGFDPSRAGEQEVVFGYEGKTASAEVYVNAAEEPDPEDPEPSEARKKLESAVKRIEAEMATMDSTLYTASSWNALEKELADAKEILEDEEASDESLETALSSLEAARNGLRRKGSSGGSGGHSSSGSSAGTTIINENDVPLSSGTGAVEGSWSVDANGGWKFRVNGELCRNQWVLAVNPFANTEQGQPAFDWFRFNEDGSMVTGWFTDADGSVYYLQETSNGTRGSMATGWNWITDANGNGNWYYFNTVSDGTKGRLLVNTTTPDGWQVDANGARIQ